MLSCTAENLLGGRTQTYLFVLLLVPIFKPFVSLLRSHLSVDDKICPSVSRWDSLSYWRLSRAVTQFFLGAFEMQKKI
jgi:hypothetical protein